jgi:hypothetical protein
MENKEPAPDAAGKLIVLFLNRINLLPGELKVVHLAI